MQTLMSSLISSSVDNPVTLAFSVLLVIFLGIGALYDAHGTLVPDTATIPYAVIGLSVAAVNQKWVTLILGTLVLLYMFSDKTPKWVQKLSDRLLMHSYKTQEAIADDVAKNDALADAFEQRYGKTLFAVQILCSAVIPFCLCPVICNISHYETTAERIAVIVVPMLLYFGGALYLKKGVTIEETTEMMAFGGADTLILIGMFGYYGFVGFIYAIAATFFVQLVWCVIVHFIKKDKIWKGTPLLPMMFFTIPLRLYVVNYLFYDTIALYNLSLGEISQLVSFLIQSKS